MVTLSLSHGWFELARLQPQATYHGPRWLVAQGCHGTTQKEGKTGALIFMFREFLVHYSCHLDGWMSGLRVLPPVAAAICHQDTISRLCPSKGGVLGDSGAFLLGVLCLQLLKEHSGSHVTRFNSYLSLEKVEGETRGAWTLEACLIKLKTVIETKDWTIDRHTLHN